MISRPLTSMLVGAIACSALLVTRPTFANSPAPVPKPFEARLTCGLFVLTLIATQEGGDSLTVRLGLGTDRMVVRSAIAASGARFEAASDPGTWVWLKGGKARVSWRGRELDECEASRMDEAGEDLEAAALAC